MSTALEKTTTSSPLWLTPRNVLVTSPHLGLEVWRFDTVSTEYETVSPSWTGCGQRMALKPGEDAQLRKGFAAFGHGSAQGAARVHQAAHPRSGDMRTGGGEPRTSVGGLSNDARIEFFP